MPSGIGRHGLSNKARMILRFTQNNAKSLFFKSKQLLGNIAPGAPHGQKLPCLPALRVPDNGKLRRKVMLQEYVPEARSSALPEWAQIP
ncbi:hypothetical protein [Pigmentiphaga humi]|uniref:hypothetical protein n=1 Tax=Pigmentiphaga humi TaxID=2478468 RepID=UPI00135A146D|nr:hypothetical protein [Pigmentiphaga humi]